MKKWKKRIAAALILAFTLPQSFGGVIAASGTWKDNNGKHWYSYSDGTYAKDTWLEDGGKWYYFNSNGYVETGLTKVGNFWYYFTPVTGVMHIGWQAINGNWYYFEASGHMKTGWLHLNEKWYYFNSNGIMVTGTTSINGKSYTFDKNGVMVSSGSTSSGSNAGEIITFGTYEQDNNTSNGKEAIEWIILEKRSDGSLFVVSRYALDRQSYNAGYVDMTWEKCALRSWLNNTFYNAAFSSAEKAKIQTTTVVNENNPYTGTKGGNNTQDKVFLLSLSEVNKYFGSTALSSQGYSINPKSACAPTPYAKVHNTFTYNFSANYYAEEMKQFSGNCWYWLRTPGPTARRAAYVNNIGEAGYASFYIYNTDCAVRPAMVIKP